MAGVAPTRRAWQKGRSRGLTAAGVSAAAHAAAVLWLAQGGLASQGMQPAGMVTASSAALLEPVSLPSAAPSQPPADQSGAGEAPQRKALKRAVESGELLLGEALLKVESRGTLAGERPRRARKSYRSLLAALRARKPRQHALVPRTIIAELCACDLALQALRQSART